MNIEELGMALRPAEQTQNEEILRILREIKRSPEMTQRQLSSRLGISLGKVNFLVKAMIQRGFVKVENFKTSTNKNAYLYYLTPKGVEQKAKTTFFFLQRKMREYEQLEEEIRQLKEEAREGGMPSDQGRDTNSM
jgi:EPS-associated MarR family transcriptional regulator